MPDQSFASRYYGRVTNGLWWSPRDSFMSLVGCTVRGSHFYRRIISRKCRQCRKLPATHHWTGPRICACGNPYVNSAFLPNENHARRLIGESYRSRGNPAMLRKLADVLEHQQFHNPLIAKCRDRANELTT